MDVSIKSADKEMRDTFIDKRDRKQATKDARIAKREARRNERRIRVHTRQLRHRFEREVRRHLLVEKRLFLKGEPNGKLYTIDASVRRRRVWRFQRSYIERLFNEALVKHNGFEYKVSFDCDHAKDLWCNRILIHYTLLNQSPTPS